MSRRVAYILKAFGRTSETFITNEMALLEASGVALSVFSLKRLTGQQRHGALGTIQAPVTYLPELPELSEMNFAAWLGRALPACLRAHGRVAVRRPAAYLAAAAEAIAMCFRYRERAWSRPRKVYFKEFLQAGVIADGVLGDPSIAHLHGHFCHGVTTVTMFVSRLTGVPFSFTAHAKDIYLGELNPGDLLPRKMQRAEFVVTCTGANQRHLNAIRPPGAAPVHTIYHGLDTRLFAPKPRSSQAAAGVPRVLSVGRFVEKKGFPFLVDACAILRDRGYAFSCLMVGAPDADLPVVEERIRAHRLESVVTIRKAVTQEELAAIYSESAIFALPCHVLDNGDRDGIPNVLAEAMAMELAVVSTDISGIPEMVRSGQNGLLVKPRSSDALAEALMYLLEREEARERFGKAARQTVLDVFDSRRNTLTLAGLFRERTGTPAPATPDREEVPC